MDHIKGVVDTVDKANEWISTQISNLVCHDGYYHNGNVVELPTGMKIKDKGFIYEEWDVT